MHPEPPLPTSVVLIRGFTVQGKDDILLGSMRRFAVTAGSMLISATALKDEFATYDAAAGSSPSPDLTGQDLGQMKLATTFYSFSPDDQLTEAITPDDERDPDAPFVLQIGNAFTTNTASSVATVNGGAAPGCSVSWRVETSAMLHTGMAFEATIAGSNSASWDTGTTLLDESALAMTGPLTLQAGTIPNCITGESSAVAVPDSAALCLGLLPVGWLDPKGALVTESA